MKSTLIIFIATLIAANGFSQNAFYRTQKILGWRDSIIIINELGNNGEIKPEEASKKKKVFLDSINSVVLFYSDSSSWKNFLKYPVMNELYNFVVEQSVDKRELLSLFKNKKPPLSILEKEAKRLLEKIKQQEDNIADLKNAITLGNLTLESIINDTAWMARDSAANVSAANDTAKVSQTIASNRVKLSQLDISVDTVRHKFDSLYNLPAFKTELYNLTRGNRLYTSSLVRYDATGFTGRIKNDFENVTQATLATKEQAIQPLKNFSFPSQSDIIDAMAIYLAKRVKQEAVLAFTDQLKKSLKTDTLLNIFFPETKRLFLSLADYDFPRFGAAWRYAISKDFIQLPDNFYKSHYAERWFGKNYSYFNDVYQVATLIRKKLTFLEIVEDLSNREDEDDLQDVLKTPAIKQFVDIAHVLNKELFSKTNNDQYWISADTWAAATPEEFRIFWALINEKYPRLLNLVNFSKINNDSRFSLSNETERKLRLWIRRILGAFNKFQSNQSELYNAQVTKTDNSWEYKVTTYWDNFHDIINMVIDNELVNQKYKTQLGKIDTTIERLFNVYEAIQQKNYSSAVEETLHMIEMFVKVPQVLSPANWGKIFFKDDLKIGGNSFKVALDNLEIDGKVKTGLLDSFINHKPGAISVSGLETINKKIQRYARQYEAYRGISFINKLELEWDNKMVTMEKWKDEFSDDQLKIGDTSLKTALDNLEVNGTKRIGLLDSIINNESMNFDSETIDAINRVINKYAEKFEELTGLSLTNKLTLLMDNTNPLYLKFAKSYPATTTALRKAAAIFQDIINANGSLELSQVIESYALPAGSYKIKRVSRWSIDLNAYFGIYGGIEWNQNNNGKYNYKNNGSVIGISAPIGISLSRAGYVPSTNSKGLGLSVGRKKVHRFYGSSHTISLGIIDIGAVVSYRLSNSAEKPLPDKLRWGQVLSPGLYYRYGFRSTPICWNIGVQYAPMLRTINNETAKNTLRLSTGFMMDLPLLNFYRN